MITIPLNRSEYTGIMYSKMREYITNYNLDADSSQSLSKFLYVISELLSDVKLSLDELKGVHKISTARMSILLDIAKNFGIWIDEHVSINQSSFVMLASQWVGKKGSLLGFQSLVASYLRTADIDELAEYIPYCGDNVAGTYLTGTMGMKCGVSNILLNTHPLYPLSAILSLIRLKITNYNPAEVEFNNALLKYADYIKPIHIEWDSTPLELKV